MLNLINPKVGAEMDHDFEKYADDPHKPVIFCTICGQEGDFSVNCPGLFQSSLESANFKNQFDMIFGKPVIISKELKKIIDNQNARK